MFQSPRRGSAAFLNESIVRDIITGRYLEPVVGRLNKGTTWNLRGVASDRGDECIMRAIVFRLGRWRLTEQEEIGWCPRDALDIFGHRSERKQQHLPVQVSGSS